MAAVAEAEEEAGRSGAEADIPRGGWVWGWGWGGEGDWGEAGRQD